MKAYAAIQSSDQTPQPSDRAEPSYAWERIGSIAGEIYPLLVEEWQNCYSQVIDVPPDPDWEGFLRLDERGGCKLLVARVEGKIAGFSGFKIFKHLHYSFIATQEDTYYVSPKHRDKGIGVQLYKLSTQKKKEMGAEWEFSYHPVGSKQYKKFCRVMKRDGWMPAEMIFVRKVGYGRK